MQISKIPVVALEQLQNNVFLLKARSKELAEKSSPGQFFNIKVSDSYFPLLRRPFSISNVENDILTFMFDIHGEGTKLLSLKKEGDNIDLIGPLGNGFNLDDDFDTAVIVAGGLGSAPFPLLLNKLSKEKKVKSFVGGRSKPNVITWKLENVNIATDDGSIGFHGNVVQLIKKHENIFTENKCKVFACGPNPMLKALQEYCLANDINCELSTECAMACGFGICQGCPIESSDKNSPYKLVCKDGPVFNAKDILI